MEFMTKNPWASKRDKYICMYLYIFDVFTWVADKRYSCIYPTVVFLSDCSKHDLLLSFILQQLHCQRSCCETWRRNTLPHSSGDFHTETPYVEVIRRFSSENTLCWSHPKIFIRNTLPQSSGDFHPETPYLSHPEIFIRKHPTSVIRRFSSENILPQSSGDFHPKTSYLSHPEIFIRKHPTSVIRIFSSGNTLPQSSGDFHPEAHSRKKAGLPDDFRMR